MHLPHTAELDIPLQCHWSLNLCRKQSSRTERLQARQRGHSRKHCGILQDRGPIKRSASRERSISKLNALGEVIQNSSIYLRRADEVERELTYSPKEAAFMQVGGTAVYDFLSQHTYSVKVHWYLRPEWSLVCSTKRRVHIRRHSNFKRCQDFQIWQ